MDCNAKPQAIRCLNKHIRKNIESFKHTKNIMHRKKIDKLHFIKIKNRSAI